MAKSISIIGASGSIGSTLAAQILRSNLLDRGDRLQLVGHDSSSSSSKLLATRIDLMDAFDDEAVEIELVANVQDTDADIVVMCADGHFGGRLENRRDLGKFNLPIFEEIATVCAQAASGALFIVVSNPVELAVEIFAEKLGRDRVIGMEQNKTLCVLPEQSVIILACADSRFLPLCWENMAKRWCLCGTA